MPILLCTDQTFSPRAETPRSLPAEHGFVVYECSSAAMAAQPRTVAGNDIHVWHASLSATAFNEKLARKLLSADELARMARFHFDNDRRNFIFCRSMLRTLLASYLGASPAELVFAYSTHGKPSLCPSSGALEFNLSHSNGLLLIGVSQRRKIGVDIERIRHDIEVNEIAGRFFSPVEQQALDQASERSRPDAFFRCWTRKEAWLTARGDGLSFPLSSFDVLDAQPDGAVTLVTRPDPAEALRWSICSIAAPRGYAAAVAVSN
jgi:4'-phosphopantetheinyl transferase